ANLPQALLAVLRRVSELDECDLFKKTADDLDTVASLASVVPRFEELPVVMMVGSVLEFARRPVLDRHFHAALPLMSVPDGVVEAELHFLIDITGEVVRGHPAGVDIERRLAAIGVGIDHLQLDRVPGSSAGGTDE